MRVIAGKYKGRTLLTPSGNSTRPTTGLVREAMFSILQAEIEGASVLDLFAGSGALGIESLSRGANDVTFCDSDRSVVEVIYKNLERVDSKCLVVNGDFKRVLNNRPQYDIIFIDAPYKSGLGVEALKLIAEKNTLKEGGIVCFERSFDIPYEVPTGLTVVKSKKYGDTALDFLKYENCGIDG